MLAWLASKTGAPLLIAVLFAALTGGGLLWHAKAAHDYGETRYQAGRHDMQALVAAMVNKGNAEQAAREAVDKERIHEIDLAAKAREVALRRRVAAVAAERDGLRQLIDDTAAAAATQPGGPAPAAAGHADDPAAALRDVSESCSRLADDLAGQAEALANQVRGLQAYAVNQAQPQAPTETRMDSP